MFSQPNRLLTQAFHPPTTEGQFTTQEFIADPQQQEQQYSRPEMLQEQVKYQIFQGYGIDPSVYPGQSLDDSVIRQSSFTGDFTLATYPSDEVNQLGNAPFDNLFFTQMTSDDLTNGPWLVDSVSTSPPQQHEIEQPVRQQTLTDSPVQTHPQLSDSSSMLSYHTEQVPIRAQTPGPLRSIPNYLHARRRSLSADNIYALAKSQGNAHSRRILVGAHNQQQNYDHLERPPFNRSTLVPSVDFGQNGQFPTTQTVKSEGDDEVMQSVVNRGIIMQGNGASSNMAVDQQVTLDTETQSIGDSNDEGQQQSNMSNEPINHAQRLNERQARFKVKLDKRNPRNMINIQVPNSANFTLQSALPNQSKLMLPSGIGIEGAVSMSTPNTPTFSPERGFAHPTSTNLSKNPPSSNKPQTPPRRGHMRKRSLSAPTQPFPNLLSQAMSSAIPLQPTQSSYPFNMPSVAPSFRRPGAIPIQIHRSHKHSHASAPISSEEYQRKLDEELEKIDFDDITVSELKDMLRQRGKPATGKKAVLMQRLQEEYENVKAMKQNNSSNGNANQYQPMLSSPTSPSGVSLHRSIANMHISSPPAHTRRFSPYGSVSIPSSPRMVPSGMGSTRVASNVAFPFTTGVDEWHFKNVGIVHHPSYGSQQLAQMEENVEHQMILLENQQQESAQQQLPQDYFGLPQPSSAPPTTTEFGSFQEPPSSAPATTTEFEASQQEPPSSAPALTTEFVDNYEFMRLDPISTMGSAMGMSEEMMSMGNLDFSPVPPADSILMKQQPIENKDCATSPPVQIDNATNMITGILPQQPDLRFEFEEPQPIMIKPGLDFDQPQEFLMTGMPQSQEQQLEIQLQMQQQQEGMTFSGGW